MDISSLPPAAFSRWQRAKLWLVPLLLPLVSAWVERQQRRILADGTPLDARSLADARALGVRRPEAVRVLAVERVGLPAGWLARLATRWAGAMATEPIGLTAGHGIFVRVGHVGDRRLLAHELAHVAQYERLGGVRPFLRRYLTECLLFSYAAAPLEREATETAGSL